MQEKILVATGIMFASMTLGSVAMAAQQSQQNWIPMQAVIGIMQDNGYTQLTQLEADDGRWEGEGIKNGEIYEFSVDPQTGKIISQHADRY